MAATQRQEVSAQIQSLRHDNKQLQMEIRRITGDTNSIELAARERLGMVKPNDIVVPIESLKPSPTLGSVSFVH
jgi:cell division protein FtsB